MGIQAIDRQEIFIPFIANLSDVEADTLARIGLERIQGDQGALIDYAVRSLIEDQIKEVDVEVDMTQILENLIPIQFEDKNTG